MLKSEMQHQFWITKKAVQRKLGSKEDEHIISSDSELDAKIEVYKSISATSIELSKLIDQYQERLCILSQEESIFGRFMKEAGKRSKTTGQTITNTGKAVSYCGQQRMCVRVPLLRLQHEVDVFRFRAVTDTQCTIAAMEKERTEYRAALEWMKSASTELDPDTGRGLEKFRTAQSHVRNAKQLFDTLSMDSIQKIDLLAAARCNMFSHVLISYMSELSQFAEKTNKIFEAISKSLEHKPKYDFCVLKDLSQNEGIQEHTSDNNTTSFDTDQSLFFAQDFVDNNDSNVSEHNEKESTITELSDGNLVELSCNSENENMFVYDQNQNDPLEKTSKCGQIYEKSAHVLSNLLAPSEQTILSPLLTSTERLKDIKNNCLDRENRIAINEKKKNSKANPWMELFADLDPFANLDVFDLKLSENCKNFQQT